MLDGSFVYVHVRGCIRVYAMRRLLLYEMSGVTQIDCILCLYGVGDQVRRQVDYGIEHPIIRAALHLLACCPGIDHVHDASVDMARTTIKDGS